MYTNFTGLSSKNRYPTHFQDYFVKKNLSKNCDLDKPLKFGLDKPLIEKQLLK